MEFAEQVENRSPKGSHIRSLAGRQNPVLIILNIIVFFNGGLDALRHQVVVQVIDLGGLKVVNVAQRHVKTNEELIDNEILKDDLVEV